MSSEHCGRPGRVLLSGPREKTKLDNPLAWTSHSYRCPLEADSRMGLANSGSRDGADAQLCPWSPGCWDQTQDVGKAGHGAVSPGEATGVSPVLTLKTPPGCLASACWGPYLCLQGAFPPAVDTAGLAYVTALAAPAPGFRMSEDQGAATQQKHSRCCAETSLKNWLVGMPVPPSLGTGKAQPPTASPCCHPKCHL